MKKSNCFNYLPFFFLGIVLAASGCEKDDSPDRDKFIGTYAVTETCDSGNDLYEIVVAASGTADNAVTVSNLYAYGETLNATVDGNAITIPSQTAGGNTYSGTGAITGNTLTINYTISGSGALDSCTATCTRK